MLKTLRIGVALLVLLVFVASVGVRLWLRSDAVRTTVEHQATAALGLPVRIGGASASVFPRIALDLRKVEVGSPTRALVDEVSIATGLGLIFARRVEAADIRLTGGYLDASLIAGIANLPSTASNAQPAVETPFTIVSIRSIRFRDVDLVAGAERIRVSLDASLARDRLDLSSVTARVKDATFQIQGQLTSLARREGHFDVRADRLPVDAILGTLGALSGGPTPSPLRITALISAPVATLAGSRVESLTARLETTRTGLVFDPLVFDIDAGRFEARLTLDQSGRTPIFDVRGEVSGVDVARLQDSAGRADRTMTGRLGARFELRGSAETSFSSLLGGARGSIDVNVRDGRMPGVEVIRQSVIRFAHRNQPVPPVEATDAFSRLDASLAMQSGTARVASLAMKAADFDLTGTGVLTVSTGRMALDVEVTLSEALSQQAGRDLYRYAREGQRVVLPAVIGGSLSAPSVSIDVAAAARRALRNRMEEQAQSILDRLMKGTGRGRPVP